MTDQGIQSGESCQLTDRRSGRVAWQEPLAIKCINDALRRVGAKRGFANKVLLYYFGLTQAVALNGNGSKITKGLINELCWVDPHYHKKARDFLVKLKLVEVEEKLEAGSGARKTVFCTLLEAPYMGYGEEEAEGDNCPRGNDDDEKTCTREKDRDDAPLAAAEEGAGCNIGTYKEVKDSDSVVTDVTTSSATSSISATGNRNDEPSTSKPSPKDWTRADIAAWHREHPTNPPDGCTWQQALLCAMATIPGYPALEANVKGGFNTLAKRLTALATRPFRGSAVPYKNWMDALLSFSSIPAPTGKATTLNYFIAALGNTAVNSIGRDHEAEHQRLMASGLPPGASKDCLVTDKDLQDILAGVYG